MFATLDDIITPQLHSVATTLAARSAFVQQHDFTIESTGGSPPGPEDPFTGRFVRWELASTDLIIVVTTALQLPSHITLFIRIGRVDGIVENHREAFLQAVKDAFPITEASTFTARPLQTAQPRKSSSTSAKGRNSARPANMKPMAMDITVDKNKGMSSTMIDKKKGKKKNRRRQQNDRKQQDPPHTAPPRLVELMRSGKESRRLFNGRK